MATSVDIAKHALSHLGDRFDLTALTDSTPEAEQVNLVYTYERDRLLREHPWKFAQKFYKPDYELAGTVPANWDYMFDYPSDCLRMLDLVNPLGRDLDPIPYDIGVTETNQKAIFCDVEEPEFRYIYKVTDVDCFDVFFFEALALRISARICMGLTGSAEMCREMERKAAIAVGSAKSQDANEGIEPSISKGPDWIRNRE